MHTGHQVMSTALCASPNDNWYPFRDDGNRSRWRWLKHHQAVNFKHLPGISWHRG